MRLLIFRILDVLKNFEFLLAIFYILFILLRIKSHLFLISQLFYSTIRVLGVLSTQASIFDHLVYSKTYLFRFFFSSIDDE